MISGKLPLTLNLGCTYVKYSHGSYGIWHASYLTCALEDTTISLAHKIHLIIDLSIVWHGRHAAAFSKPFACIVHSWYHIYGRPVPVE